MKGLVDRFLYNPVAANLLMAALLIGGLSSLRRLPIEGFPKLPPQQLRVLVEVPGLSPERVADTVSRPLERALEGIEGIDRHRSSSGPGYAELLIEKTARADIQELLGRVKAKLEAVPLPPRAHRPLIEALSWTMGALYVQLYARPGFSVDAESLDRAARQVRQALLAAPEITRLSSFGERPKELRIELDPAASRAHGVGAEELLGLIEARLVTLREGELQTEGGAIAISTRGPAPSVQQLSSWTLKTRADGSQLRLQDVARVREDFGESLLEARFQGQPSIGFEILTSPKGDLRAVAAATRRTIETLRPQLPEGMALDSWGDMSVYIEARLALLRSSAAQGLLLVFGVLALFLDLRLAFWVAAGIPIALGGAMLVLGPLGLDQSLNDITTFGLLIVLGILVDDAVVVGESVFEAKRRAPGDDPLAATRRGVHWVAIATVFGVLTTVAAFLPLGFLPNEIGRIFGSFAGVVIAALVFSLVESKLILPAHLSTLRIHPRSGRIARVQAVCRCGLDRLRDRLLRPALSMALRHRTPTLIGFVAVSVIAVGLVLRGDVRVVFFPEIPGDIIQIELRAEADASPALVERMLHRVEAAGEALAVERVMSARLGPHDVVVYGELKPAAERTTPTVELAKRWRDDIGSLEGLASLSVTASEETGGGFALDLSAPERATLERATEVLLEALRNEAGVDDARSDLERRRPELQLALHPAAMAQGLGEASFRRQVALYFGGEELERLSSPDGRALPLMVRLPSERRSSRAELEAQSLIDDHGRWHALRQVIRPAQRTEAARELRHVNGRPSVSLYAKLDPRVRTAPELLERLSPVLERLQAEHPELRVDIEGEAREQAELSRALQAALVFGLLGIYALLAIPLRSYGMPLVIMSVVPFGFAGAVFGHHLLGLPLSLLSLLGMLALAGVVVNDSLVLATQYRTLTRVHTARRAALRAGLGRFRAIFLTTATTCIGLAPLMLERSEQAQYLIPAAVSLAFGELFGTAITLVLVPVLLSFHSASGADRPPSSAMDGDRCRVHDFAPG